MKYYLLLLSFCVQTYCFAQQEISLANQTSDKKVVRLSSIAFEIENIPLELTDKCILSTDLAVCCTSKFIFISDLQTSSFYRFSRETGAFLNSIGQRGQGPGEYSRALCFSVDEEEERVYLIDTFAKKVLVYTFEGKFIHTLPLEAPTYMFMKLKNEFYYYNINYLQSKYELYKANSKGEILNQSLTEKNDLIKDKNPFSLEMPFFYKHKENLFFKNTVSNNIYKIDNSLNKQIVYKFLLGKYSRRNEDRDFEMQENKARSIAKEQQITICDLFETNKSIFISYTLGDKNCMAIYDKNNKSTIIPFTNGEYGIEDDLSYGKNFLYYSNIANHCCSVINNEIVSILQCSDIDFEQYTEGEFAKCLSSLDIDSNPIVRIIKIKN